MLEQKKDLLLKNIPCENTLKKNFTSIDTYNKKDISENLDTKYKLNNNSGVDNSNLINSIYTNNKKVTFKNKYNEESKINKKWKLYRVICGHTGWVRCVDIDPTNHWFVTGSTDKIIKFWDLASGKLKLSLTGHTNTVRSVKVSTLSPYLYSAGEDRRVKCWDLEQNKVIRDYHGHLSGVYSVDAHPNQQILVSAGRDCCLRIWDVRTKSQISVIEGHSNTISQVIMQSNEPQIISSSHDSTIRFLDLRNLKTLKVLTNHKKAVRSICLTELCDNSIDNDLNQHKNLVSGGCDNIKFWDMQYDGEFKHNMKDSLENIHEMNSNEYNKNRIDYKNIVNKLGEDENKVVNTLTINKDNIMVAGLDSGFLRFWDLDSGYNFQNIQVIPQPGSLESESSIFGAKFDLSSTRLITTECDKTIKMWKEVEIDV